MSLNLGCFDFSFGWKCEICSDRKVKVLKLAFCIHVAVTGPFYTVSKSGILSRQQLKRYSVENNKYDVQQIINQWLLSYPARCAFHAYGISTPS
jgi:hypothetical protein